MPQTIKCQLAIREYGSSIYSKEAVDETDSLYKNQKNLNLTLQYNELPTWKDHSNTPKCVIDMSELTTADNTLENILQVTSDQEAVMAYYYMDENNKVQVTEIFDVTDSESHGMLSVDEVENNTKLQFDEWDEPAWLSQHTLDDVTESLFTDGNQQSMENLSDLSLDDDIFGSSHISSDPESKWAVNKDRQIIQASNQDYRLEVDQSPLDI